MSGSRYPSAAALTVMVVFAGTAWEQPAGGSEPGGGTPAPVSGGAQAPGPQPPEDEPPAGTAPEDAPPADDDPPEDIDVEIPREDLREPGETGRRPESPVGPKSASGAAGLPSTGIAVLAVAGVGLGFLVGGLALQWLSGGWRRRRFGA